MTTLHTEKCKGCVYWRKMNGRYSACHYSLDNDELRHCDPAVCNKRATGKYKRKNNIMYA